MINMKTTPFIVAMLLASGVWGQPAPPTVLFVCEHGAVKSVVAAARFNHLATERGLPFRAVSRGTAPDPMVPAPVSDGLKGEGLTVPAGILTRSRHRDRPWAGGALAGCDLRRGTCQVFRQDVSRITHWDNLPAFSDGYGPASRAIAANVDALLRELEAAMKKKR